jgi:hypothetical protein
MRKMHAANTSSSSKQISLVFFFGNGLFGRKQTGENLVGFDCCLHSTLLTTLEVVCLGQNNDEDSFSLSCFIRKLAHLLPHIVGLLLGFCLAFFFSLADSASFLEHFLSIIVVGLLCCLPLLEVLLVG